MEEEPGKEKVKGTPLFLIIILLQLNDRPNVRQEDVLQCIDFLFLIPCAVVTK